MYNKFFAASIPGSMMFGIAGAADAVSAFDQSIMPINDDSHTVIGTHDNAQTFTIGINGMLTMIDLYINKLATTDSDLLFDIRLTNNGRPVESDDGNDLLVSMVIPKDDVPFKTDSYLFHNPVSIDLSPYGIFVADGEILAITLRTEKLGPAQYKWNLIRTGFTRGGAFIRGSNVGPTWIMDYTREVSWS